MKNTPLVKNIRTWLYDDTNASRRLEIATVTMPCAIEPNKNLKTIIQNIEHIKQKHPGIEFIMFGEMILGHYDPGNHPAYHHEISESIPGNTTRVLQKQALKHGTYICFGMSEESDGKLFNTQVLVNPEGKIQACHRKWNLKPSEIQAGYQPGSLPVTITTVKDIKIALIICSDAAHPQTMKSLLRNRPELILFSLADDQDEDWFVAKANARLYTAWIVSANRFGQESHYWNGHTVISDPVGTLRATSVNKAGVLAYNLGFAETMGITKRVSSIIWVKLPLLLHVLTHIKTLLSYYA